MSVVSLKAGIISAVAGVGLVAGGLFLGSTLVGAQEPSPTPSTPQQQTPAPSDDGASPRDDGDCPKDGSSSGSTTGGGGRGRGPVAGSFARF